MSYSLHEGDIAMTGNQDLSGDVRFRLPISAIDVPAGAQYGIVTIPGQFLFNRIADVVRIKRMAALEEMTTDEILGLEGPRS